MQGQNLAAEAATRELLYQAQAVQQGKAELASASALAATRELAKEVQALKEHVLKATSATANTANTAHTASTANTARQAKKTYADAAGQSAATYPNNTKHQLWAHPARLL